MTTLQVEFSTADLGEVEVWVGDTYFWVDTEINSAYIEHADMRQEEVDPAVACARLGIDPDDLREAAYAVSCAPYAATRTPIDSDHTAEHLADLFGCDASDVAGACDNCGDPAVFGDADGRYCDEPCEAAYNLH